MDKYRFFSMPLISIMSVVFLVGCGGGEDDSDHNPSPAPSAWFQAFGLEELPSGTPEYGKSGIQTTDGGYVIVGDFFVNEFGSEILFINTDKRGDIIAADGLGFGAGNDYGASVQQSTDGSFVVLGDCMLGSNRQMLLTKFDLDGRQWDRLFGYSDQHEFASEVQQTTDGGYILIGTTAPFGGGNTNVFLIKTNGSGATQWYDQKGYDNYHELGASIRQTSDGGYVLTGRTNRYDNFFDLWIVKVDSNGATDWHNHYGRTGSEDRGTSIRQTNDGGYIAVGYTETSSRMIDIFLLKIDSAGNQQWSKSLGGPNSDYGEEVQQTTDGGYIIAGGTDSFGAGGSDGYLIKTDGAGEILWEQTFGGSGKDYFYSVQQTSDGGYMMVGSSESFGDGSSDVFLVKTDRNGSPLP